MNIESIIVVMRNIVGAALPVVIALAVILFFWGLAMFILHSGDETKRSEGRQIMIWGIITLFVMISVWGLVAVIATTFSITAGAPAVPQVPGVI